MTGSKEAVSEGRKLIGGGARDLSLDKLAIDEGGSPSTLFFQI